MTADALRPEGASDPNYQQVLVGQKSLKMRAGKLAAQAAHASLAAITGGPGAHIQTDRPGGSALVVPLDPDLFAWLTGRCTRGRRPRACVAP